MTHITPELKLAWAQEWIKLKIDQGDQGMPDKVMIINDKTVTDTHTWLHGIWVDFDEYCRYKTNALSKHKQPIIQ